MDGGALGHLRAPGVGDVAARIAGDPLAAGAGAVAGPGAAAERESWVPLREVRCALALRRAAGEPDLRRALSLACASVRAVLAETVEELALIPAQSALVAPQGVIDAVRIPVT